LRDSLRALARRFEACDPIDVGARTLFALFLLSTWVTTDLWYFKFPLRALSIAALVLPPLHRDPRLWATFAVLLCAKTARNWFTQDNHLFLVTWFSVGMVLALRSSDPLRAARENARRLIGLSFLFAALWKGPLSGEFLNGSYFSFTFLTDPRFHGAARLVGGIPEEALAWNYGTVARLAQAGVESVTLAGLAPRLLLASRLVAWWTFAIESALALAFLAPERWKRLHASRHILLLVFGVTTYLVVDIKTFGWSLMAIGAAQSEPERPGIRALYFAVGLLILAYDCFPVLDAVASWLL
jgi:hypothetical protein